MKITHEMPPIAEKVLYRAMEIAALPKGKHKIKDRHVDARRLAYRLRVAEGFTKAGAGPHGADTWRNISEFMAGAIAESDFQTLDHFCAAWISLKDSMTPGHTANRWIASAVLALQRELGRAPTNGEIVKQVETKRKIFVHGPNVEHDLHGMKIGKTAVNAFIESLGIGCCLSKGKTGRGN